MKPKPCSSGVVVPAKEAPDDEASLKEKLFRTFGLARSALKVSDVGVKSVCVVAGSLGEKFFDGLPRMT